MNINSCLIGSASSSSNVKGKTYSHRLLWLTHAHAHFHTSVRLDRKVKELAQEKEELLKTSKFQAATTENVKVQIETLLKVALPFLSVRNRLIHPRPRQKSERRSKSLYPPLRTHPETRPCRVNIPILGVLSHIFRILPILSCYPPHNQLYADSNEFDGY
jgi:hypothetical protein